MDIKKHIFILVFLTSNALLSSNCSKILNLTVLAGGIVSLIDVLKYTLK